ncbi:FAD-binding oxidoreductase [Lysobacter hankyongensis]|uniref:FAD dependent oxidoreductase domain-containing protein n=1 Tax=Lysobacter hankyongensis TaxID=1176535 RepID=A0ABP9C2D1_9GAMM
MKFDFVVIGSGILGLTLTLELARIASNAKIALLDEKKINRTASLAAGAMLSRYCETTKFSLDSETDHWKERIRNRIIAADYWESWRKTLAKLDYCAKSTVLFTNNCSNQLDADNLKAIQQVMSTQGEQALELTEDEIELAPEYYARADRIVLVRNEPAIEARQLLRSIFNELGNFPNVCIVEKSVLSISETSKNSFALALQGGLNITASSITVAAGAETTRIIDRSFPDLGKRIVPIISGNGAAITVSKINPIKYVYRTPNRAFSCGLHAVPYSDAIYFGATNTVQAMPSRAPIATDIGFIIDCVSSQIGKKWIEGEIEHFKHGNRPVSIDGFPVIGRTSIKNLWIYTGFYREGILMAPWASSLLAKCIIHDTSISAELSAYDPERKLIRTHSYNQCIDHAVENFHAIACERGLRLPSTGNWTQDFLGSYRSISEAIYARFEPHYRPPPDFLWDIHFGRLESELKELIERREI